ncbi:alpha/beta hydrolase [soil metagenome]
MPSTSTASYHLDTIAVGEPTKAPVLCLPGLFAGAWVFERLLPLLAARGYPASAISYRGHPPLSPLASIGRQSVTDFALDACEAARSLDRPIVIAHSLGGLVALMMAGRNLIRAAVLVSPAPPRGISVLSPAILVRMATYLPALLFSRPFLPTAAHLDALVLNCVPKADRAAIRDRFVPDSGRAAREIALGAYQVPPRAIRAPVFVVGAEHDRFIPVGVARRIATQYGAPFHMAAGHGHFILSEPGWEREARVMLDWIDALPRSIRDVGSDVRHG